MKSEKRFSSAICAFQNTSDRYVTGGYKESITMKEMINSTKSIPDLEGVELVEGWNVTNDNLEEVKDLLQVRRFLILRRLRHFFTSQRRNCPRFSPYLGIKLYFQNLLKIYL